MLRDATMPKANQQAIEMGRRLHEAAEFRKMKQANIARALGARTGTIARYFSGTRSASDIDLLGDIAALLGVSYEWLSLGRGGPNYDPTWRRPPPKDASGALERTDLRGARAVETVGAVGAPGHFSSAAPAAGEDPYPQRQRALNTLRPHLKTDDRVRVHLLSLSGPPYHAWAREDWEAEALRERERIVRFDARWKHSEEATPQAEPKPRKAGALREQARAVLVVRRRLDRQRRVRRRGPAR